MMAFLLLRMLLGLVACILSDTEASWVLVGTWINASYEGPDGIPAKVVYRADGPVEFCELISVPLSSIQRLHPVGFVSASNQKDRGTGTHMGGQTSRFGSECTGGRVKARSHSMLVLFQPLTLDLGVAPGDALSLLP